MSKKIISSFTLLFFSIFTLSCSYYKTEKVRVENIRDWTGKEVTIVGIQKTSREYIKFLKDSPLIIQNRAIVGPVKKDLEIDRAEVRKITYRDADREIAEIITKDGKVYPVISSRMTEDKIIFKGYESTSIPLQEIDLVWIRTTGRAKLVAAVIGLGVIVAIIIAASAPKKPTYGESCPLVYAFDGKQYIFDAEPYGGAICQGLKKTDWCVLENLKEINAYYKILVTNELDETQYTDELKLLVVDHPKNVRVIPDVLGRIHTVSQPLVPLRAYDSRGENLMPLISLNDRVFWLSSGQEKDPDERQNLRDELLFDFPKPEGAKNVKLIVNACSTFWGSHSLRRYLDLYGDKVSEWYEEVNNFGPAFFKMVNTHVREELYSLQIRVKTEDGWKSKGLIRGGGPLISKEKIYSFDIGDVPENVLKIKLTPPAAFWMINYFAVDYTEDLPVKVKEIGAVFAVDHKGRDVREILANNDNQYLVMPNIGDRTELIFESPPRLDGMDRTVILKACGYYDIHLKAEGNPQTELLERLHVEPGFAVQYAFKEYLNWKKENMEKMSRK